MLQVAVKLQVAGVAGCRCCRLQVLQVAGVAGCKVGLGFQTANASLVQPYQIANRKYKPSPTLLNRFGKVGLGWTRVKV